MILMKDINKESTFNTYLPFMPLITIANFDYEIRGKGRPNGFLQDSINVLPIHLHL